MQGGLSSHRVSVAYHQDPSDRHEYVIDVASIGSETRLDYLQAQVDTWAGTHRAVRHFWGLTEHEDIKKSCDSRFAEEVERLSRTCRSKSGFAPSIATFVHRYYGFGEGLRDHIKDTGWICAQRRIGPVLRWLEAQYAGAARESDLPDLLVLVDDDTVLDVDQVRRFMTNQAKHPRGPIVRAGCAVQEDRDSEVAFSFPYGGFGTFFDKHALREMIRPIRCTANATSVVDKRICATLKENRMGERLLFEEGITILELFRRYSALPVYCMHSDWMLGYIVKFYLPESALLGVETYPRCGNITSDMTARPCDDIFATCHNMKPEDMESLALSYFVRAPGSFRATPHLAATSMAAAAETLAAKRATQEARSQLQLPDVLLIGAQKAGTTTVSGYDAFLFTGQSCTFRIVTSALINPLLCGI